ncbi:MAG: glycosyltransferase family 2 protein [Gammaproteobacteria bacterium]|nr:glycosyltransferase family 2 protein [Gammaproteobacteria bacterium]MYC24458.1 glycosyltransferase family 2 protein [Gammaproteobacteria bacterium]
MFKGIRVGVVIPALNEEASIGLVVRDIYSQRNEDGTQIVDDLVVCDNGSTDSTARVATEAGATLVSDQKKGYGRACLTAIETVRKQSPGIVVFTDGDHAFDANDIPTMLHSIDQGADLVIGSRTLGNCEPGALSVAQRIGNRVATALIGLLWGVTITDLGPYRAIRTTALDRLCMRDEAFGWTVEMQLKAIKMDMRIVEIPVNTRVRLGYSKISGTFKGVVLAGTAILLKIIQLRIFNPTTSSIHYR